MTTRTDDSIRGSGRPTNLGDFERYPLLFGPSPVHRLERLTSHLGGATLWAKRDDCNSGLAYGGDKTRKLEYLVADALDQGCDTLVSIGGVQSNHTRQVAAVAAKAGMGCVLVQESWVDWPDVVYDRVGNIQLSRIMGADVRRRTHPLPSPPLGVALSYTLLAHFPRTSGHTPVNRCRLEVELRVRYRQLFSTCATGSA